tara:strand:- start:95 stop:1150 length:1056 start_codon:yes stop_codon:yes gene_type:complete
MKKKSLSVKKKIHNILLANLKNPKIKKSYGVFKKNINKLGDIRKFAAAVSGGPDSLALSYFLKCYSLQNKTKVFFYQVDHGLRKNSLKESRLVQRKMKNFDINSKILLWRGKKPYSNIQSIAREKRYSYIFKQCTKDKVNTILTAHHEGDLYENFFIRILRGSGLRGIVSFNSLQVRLDNNINICRPLIELKKNDLIYTAKKVFNFYLKDPSNKNSVFRRSRIRKLIQELKLEGLDFNKLKLTINNLSDSNNAINYYVRNNIKNNSKYIKNKSMYILSLKFFDNPDEIIFRSLSKLIKEVGQKYYSARGKSILNILNEINRQNFKKLTLSGCIIEKLNNSVIIYKEFTKKS